MPKSIFSCDLDNVIADNHGPIIDRMNAEFGLELSPDDIVEFWMEPIIAPYVENPTAWFHSVFSDPVYLDSLPPILPTIRALRQIRGIFDEVHIVTARPPETRNTTIKWLNEFGITYDELVMNHEKLEYCQSVKSHYIMEDAPHTAEKCHKHAMGVFLIDKPYNRGVESKGGLWRINIATEAVPILREEQANKRI